jgi:hypothetical protein
MQLCLVRAQQLGKDRGTVSSPVRILQAAKRPSTTVFPVNTVVAVAWTFRSCSRSDARR